MSGFFGRLLVEVFPALGFRYLLSLIDPEQTFFGGVPVEDEGATVTYVACPRSLLLPQGHGLGNLGSEGIKLILLQGLLTGQNCL